MCSRPQSSPPPFIPTSRRVCANAASRGRHPESTQTASPTSIAPKERRPGAAWVGPSVYGVALKSSLFFTETRSSPEMREAEGYDLNVIS
jgi:hypothetical protein